VRSWKLVIAAFVVAGVIAAVYWFPAGAAVGHAVRFIRDLGPLGLLLYALLFVVSCLLLLPTTPVFLAAGLLYGFGWGTVLLTVLAIAVDLLTVVLVHSRLRPRIQYHLDHHERLAAVDDAVHENALMLGSLLRLSLFVPFGPLNYALAMTRMPLWQHVVTNAAGMIPCNLLMAYAGSIVSKATRLDEAKLPGVWSQVALLGGLGVTIAASVWIGITIRHAIAQCGSHTSATTQGGS
jgi:uncharacterized membrane protein YdjX (TVP38/TMEM64 family)